MNLLLSVFRFAFPLLLVGLPAFAISPNAVELELAALVGNHSAQKRSQMIYDPILNMIARAKAVDLAERRYFDHVDPDGYGPNKAASLAGYQLPEFWGDDNDENFIESIAAGPSSGSQAFAQWMNSPGHRRHLLGEVDFYAQQTHYGVGFAEVPGSPYQRYYVFISAPPNLAAGKSLEPYAEWLFSFFTPAEIDREGDRSDVNRNGVPRIFEFVLGWDPDQANKWPVPEWNEARQRLEWPLPIRHDLGSIQVKVEASPDLSPDSWSSDGVEHRDSVHAAPPGWRGFMRLRASRD